MHPQLNNRLIDVGNQVVLGTLSIQEAGEIVAADEELSNLADEQLWTAIEEAEHYWRDKLDVAVKHPKNILVYPLLITSCAESRLKAISKLRRGSDDAGKPALDSRMAQWITNTARCMLSNAMAFLLLPDYRSAWEMFSRAELAARALPDGGRARLREVLWSTYGQFISAQALQRDAEQQMDSLMSAPDNQQQTQAHFAEVRQEFTIFGNVFQQRQQFLDSKSSDTPPPDSPKPVTLPYADQLNGYLRRIQKGELELAEAKRLLLEALDFSQLDGATLAIVSAMHLKSAESAPEQAVVLAELNHAVASAFDGSQAEQARVSCGKVLGLALTARARRNENDAEDLRRAIPYLEEALESMELAERPETAQERATILNKLAVCYRAVGNFEKALSTNLRVIERWKALDNSVEMAVAYGNLADVQEQLGDSVSAFGNHYKAFQLFLEAKKLRHAQQALKYLSRLSAQTGRSDDAISALEMMAGLRVQMADLRGAAQSYLSLGENRFRVGRLKEASEAFLRAEQLIKPVISVEQPEKKYLSLYIDVLVWRGTVLTLLYKHLPDKFPVEMAYDVLYEARMLSMNIQDERLYARAVLQSANLFHLAGDYETAEAHLNWLHAVNVSPTVEARSLELRGTIRMGQMRYREAVEYLQKALATYPPEQADRKMATLDITGQAYERGRRYNEAIKSYEAAIEIFEKLRHGLYEESRMQFTATAKGIYERLIVLCSIATADPIRAFYWLEKSKSRTFAETMGLSLLPLRDLPDNVKADWHEEQQLLQRINDIRSTLFYSPENASDSLAAQKELQEALHRLNAVWDRMAIHCDEYVALRRGSAISWNALQSLLKAAPSA